MDRLDARLFTVGLRSGGAVRTRYLGTDYGGWAIPADAIDSSWVCYTAGIGEDASFDLELARLGCDVVAIDPTPRAIAHMEPHLSAFPNLHLERCALWSEDAEVEFFPPTDPAHVSFSITNRQGTSAPIQVPARNPATLARKHGHDRVDLLKLDIEGAEYELLDAIRCSELGVRVLCVEYHHDHGLRRMRSAVRHVLADGYRIAAVNRTDVTFYRP